MGTIKDKPLPFLLETIKTEYEKTNLFPFDLVAGFFFGFCEPPFYQHRCNHREPAARSQ